VCDCAVTVNAKRAESGVLELLQTSLFSEERLQALERRVQSRLERAARGRREHSAEVGVLRAELAEVDQEIERLVNAVAEGVLVEQLRARMALAEARRKGILRELALAESADVPAVLSVLPSAIGGIVRDLRQMLARGKVGAVRTALGSLVERIEVRAEALPGQPRPGARLILRGNLVGALRLVHGNVKRAYSPGGIRTLVTIETPVREWKLQGRWYRAGGIALEQRRAAYAL